MPGNARGRRLADGRTEAGVTLLLLLLLLVVLVVVEHCGCGCCCYLLHWHTAATRVNDGLETAATRRRRHC